MKRGKRSIEINSNMAKNSLTVKTQLIPPRLKKNILRRDRLLKILQNNLDKKLILVTGGAGYGKTTLLSQFVNELKNPFVFYTISESDSNLNTFLAYLIQGIRGTYGSASLTTSKTFGIRTQSVMATVPNPGLEMLMGTFINELVDVVNKELFIILEDCHLIDRVEAINRGLDYLLEHMPFNVHLIISTRALPPLSIARIRAKGNLLELTGDDLKFTYVEIRALFKEIYKLDISEPLIRKIEHYSEGWVTALHLMSYIIERAPEKMGAQYIVPLQGKESLDYFESEVFEEQLEGIRSFLLKSCILEQLTPNSCNAVLMINNSREILEDLLKRNLFISCIDERKEVFCYHQLFRDFLLNRLAQAGNRHVCSLHLRAADYFKAQKEYSNSIRHYLLAKETKRAVELIEREGENLIEARGFDTLEQWLNGLPRKIIQSRPTLLWYQGEIFRLQGRWDSAMKVYKKVKFVKEEGGEESAKAIYGMACILSYRGAYAKAIKLGKKALQIIGKENISIRANLLNHIGGAYYSLGNTRKAISIVSEGLRMCKKNPALSGQEKLLSHNLLAYYTELGELDRGIEASQQIIKRVSSCPDYSLGWVYSNLGITYTFKGEFGHARDSLRKALQVNRAFNDKRGINFTLSNFGLLNLMLGNYKQARSYCEKVMRLNINMRESALTLHALHYISMSYLFERELVKAEEYINKAIPEDEAYKTSDESLITKAQIKLELGNLKEAEEVLNLAFTRIRKSQSKFNLMLVHTALAKLYYKKGAEVQDAEVQGKRQTRRGGDTGKERMIIKHLRKALELSKRYNYHFGLIKLGRVDTHLLQYALNEGITSRYAEFLLEEVEKEYDLVISFFGELRIKTGNEIPAHEKWKRQKSKSIFCYLLSNRGKKFSRDQLIEVFWPGKSLSKARGNLHPVLTEIRNRFFTEKKAPFIDYKDEVYWVSPDYKIWIDLEEFDRLIKEAHQWETKKTVISKNLKPITLENEQISISKYESAINLYVGDFLPEIYDNWSEELRIFYKSQYIDALEKVADFYMKKQEFRKVINSCKKIIAQDEFRENAYLLAMHCYIAIGNRKAAIDLYKRLEKTLKVELNIGPSIEINRLFHELTGKT